MIYNKFILKIGKYYFIFAKTIFMKKTVKVILPTLIIIAISLVALVGYYFYLDSKNNKNSTTIIDVVPKDQNTMADSLRFTDIELSQKETESWELKKQIAFKTSGHTIYGDLGSGTSSILLAHDALDRSKKFLLLGYLGLPNKSDERFFPEYRFYTKNDTGYIAKLIFNVNKTRPGKQEHTYTYGNFKKVNYLHSVQKNITGILIPVQSNFLKIFYKIFLCVFSILLVLGGVFMLITSVIVVINISKGKAFSELNILRLKWMAIICFAGMLLPYLLNGIFYLIYFKSFFPEVTFTHSFFDQDYKVMIIGFIYWLLFLAFKKGYKLQQENELTV